MERYVKYDENTMEILGVYEKEVKNSILMPIKFINSNNILEVVKNWKLQQLKEKINQKYKAYIEKYPEVEIASFKDKAKEAMLIKKDPNIPLEDTPYLSALANNNLEIRNQLAKAVLAKINEAAQLEAYGVQMREKIKNSQTLEELLNLGI